MSPAVSTLSRSYLYAPQFAPRPARRRSLSALGSLTPAQLAQQIGGLTGSLATGALAAASLAGVITSATAAVAIPIVGAAIAAVTVGVAAILNSGCGQTCIVTSNWANQAEQLLIQNIQGYFALPTPRSQSAQAVAVANFDNVWAYLSQQCGQSALGTAGVDCTKDRMRGACKWTQTTTSPLLQYPGEPQPGACWNWFNGYRDPIANDPNVAPDSVAAPAGSSTGTGITSILNSPIDPQSLVLYGGLALLALGLMGALS